MHSKFMKNTKITLKILALALAVAMIVPVLASCANKAVMTFTADNGKTYSVSESDVIFLMTYLKAETLMEYGVQSKYADSFFASKMTNSDVTYDADATQTAINQLKTWLIEKYIFEKYGLSYDAEKLATYEKQTKQSKQDRGGAGAFKQYWGYTANQLLDYYKVQLRADAINEYLYGEQGKDPVTAEDKETYYTENYVGYQIIQLDMKNKVKLDEEDHRVRKQTTDEDGNITFKDEYEKVELTDEEASEKALLPKLILDKLEAGEDFKALALQYSDSYLSQKYEDGVFVLNTTHIVENEAVISALEKLEVGEYTEAISISDGTYTYIIKRVGLLDKAYENDEYTDLFLSYEDLVEDHKYELFLDPYMSLIVVPNDMSTKYTVSKMYTTEYVDLYYTYTQYYSSLS